MAHLKCRDLIFYLGVGWRVVRRKASIGGVGENSKEWGGADNSRTEPPPESWKLLVECRLSDFSFRWHLLLFGSDAAARRLQPFCGGSRRRAAPSNVWLKWKRRPSCGLFKLEIIDCEKMSLRCTRALVPRSCLLFVHGLLQRASRFSDVNVDKWMKGCFSQCTLSHYGFGRRAQPWNIFAVAFMCTKISYIQEKKVSLEIVLTWQKTPFILQRTKVGLCNFSLLLAFSIYASAQYRLTISATNSDISRYRVATRDNYITTNIVSLRDS